MLLKIENQQIIKKKKNNGSVSHNGNTGRRNLRSKMREEEIKIKERKRMNLIEQKDFLKSKKRVEQKAKMASLKKTLFL